MDQEMIDLELEVFDPEASKKYSIKEVVEHAWGRPGIDQRLIFLPTRIQQLVFSPI